MQLSFDDISFTHDNAVTPLLDRVTAHFPTGWTGIVGANGTGKTTLLRLALGELSPQVGTVRRPGALIYCPQRTDDSPSAFADFLEACDADAFRLQGQLGIQDDWGIRWETLSHGERKRAQIAVALWSAPDVLLIDEPTNHIDADARAMLLQTLRAFRGIGLLVSHDRDLLDTLCRQCLFLDPPDAVMRPGGYTEAAAQAEREEQEATGERQSARHALAQLSQEETRRREEARRLESQRSKRKLARHDSDGRRKLDVVRVSGKDGQAGRLLAQLDGRLRQAQDRLEQSRMKKRYDLNFWLPGSCSQRDWLFRLSAGRIPLDGTRELHFPELSMRPSDRIAITGPNGTGKSTLIRHLVEHLAVPMEKVIYLPQEIDLATSRTIMAEVNTLSHDELGLVMTVVSCLGSRPERLLGSLESSPGEIRKVMLALGVIRAPHLIIMDEPTNHLDVPAIELLEGALDGCPCGLLLVSHDLRFLSRLATARWHIATEGQHSMVQVTSMA